MGVSILGNGVTIERAGDEFILEPKWPKALLPHKGTAAKGSCRNLGLIFAFGVQELQVTGFNPGYEKVKTTNFRRLNKVRVV